MRKAFNINNYLREGSQRGSTQKSQLAEPTNSRVKKLNFYEQYLQKNQSNSPSYQNEEANDPFKRTATTDTADYSNKRQDVGTTRYKHPSSMKADPAGSSGNKNQPTQRQTYEKNQSNSNIRSSKKNQRQIEHQLQKNIWQLKQIKGELEKQIFLLQSLLDETSHNLDSIDLEFERIKEKILSFTSRSLDNAFRIYKNNMVRWAKYEEAQKKSLEVALEMKQSISQSEAMLTRIREGFAIQNIDNSLRQITNRVQHYRITVEEINRIREQCYNKHPSLKEQKIAEFERGLEQLCNF